MSLRRIKPFLSKFAALVSMALIVIGATANLTHAQVAPAITFSQNSQGTWHIDSNYPDEWVYAFWIASNGAGRDGYISHSFDTNVPTSSKMEVIVADVGNHPFQDTCSTPPFTGDAEVDLSCIADAITTMGYTYTILESPDPSTLPPLPPPAPPIPAPLPAPCVCP